MQHGHSRLLAIVGSRTGCDLCDTCSGREQAQLCAWAASWAEAVPPLHARRSCKGVGDWLAGCQQY
jgi:hypothetical protein